MRCRIAFLSLLATMGLSIYSASLSNQAIANPHNHDRASMTLMSAIYYTCHPISISAQVAIMMPYFLISFVQSLLVMAKVVVDT
jgi:hypothetical protein